MVKKSGSVIINPPKKTPEKRQDRETGKGKNNSEKEDKEPEEEESKQADTELKRLEKMVEDENKVLYEMSSVFPFQLFPDKVTVYTNRVVIVHKHLLAKNLFPIMVNDIRTVTVHRGPIFASFNLEVGGYEQNPGDVTHLWPEHASRAESIIVGLLSAVRDRRLDISKVPFQKAKRVLRKLGETKEKIETIT